MDQNKFIMKMAQEGSKCDEIEISLHEEFGRRAFKKSTIYKHIRETKFNENDDDKKKAIGRPIDERIDPDIMSVIDENPNSSVRDIAGLLRISTSTVWIHLTESIGMKYALSRWIPHFLSEKNKADRVNLSSELFSVLSNAKRNAWHGIVTGDETWLYYGYYHPGKWIVDTEEHPISITRTIDCEKVMLTVIWSVEGFHVIDFLPPKMNFNSEYFIEHILNPLAENLKDSVHDLPKRKIGTTVI